MNEGFRWHEVDLNKMYPSVKLWYRTYGLFWFQWYALGIITGGIVATAAFWFGRVML